MDARQTLYYEAIVLCLLSWAHTVAQAELKLRILFLSLSVSQGSIAHAQLFGYI